MDQLGSVGFFGHKKKKTGRSFIASSGLVVATLVTLLVHVFGVLLGVVVGLLAVNPVHTLGLGELVDLAANEASNELLGESVAHGLAYSVQDGLEDDSKWHETG